MYEYGTIDARQFSLCFQSQHQASREGTLAGVMTLGGSNTRLHKRPMVFAKELNPPSSSDFYVYIEKIFLWNGEGRNYHPEEIGDANSNSTLLEVKVDELKVNSKHGAMVDSGSTDTYFPSAVTEMF